MFTDFLKRPNSEVFIITHTTADETGDLINSFESSKNVGPNSIPTKIMKIAKEITYLPLPILIINSISQEISKKGK